MWAVGAVAGVVSSLLVIVLVAIAEGAGVPMEVAENSTAQPEQIPLLGYTMVILGSTLIGLLLATAFARWARRPRLAFVITALVLTAVSFAFPATTTATAATKVVLEITHVVAAALIIAGSPPPAPAPGADMATPSTRPTQSAPSIAPHRAGTWATLDEADDVTPAGSRWSRADDLVDPLPRQHTFETRSRADARLGSRASGPMAGSIVRRAWKSMRLAWTTRPCRRRLRRGARSVRRRADSRRRRFGCARCRLDRSPTGSNRGPGRSRQVRRSPSR